MQIELRDYQEQCVKTVLKKFSEGVNRQAVQLPTGSGKTVCMVALAKALGKKTLLIAHRRELLTQAADKFKLIYPEASVGICMGSSNELNADVVIGSIQTCMQPNRLAELKELGFGLILVDEAHHAAAPSYRRVIDTLFNDDTLLLGVSATLQRMDGESLEDVFDEIVFQLEIGEMIEQGHLSPLKSRQILTRCNVGKVDVARGDFIQSQLSEAVNTNERNNFIVSKYLEHTPDTKGAAFCVDVQHCKDLANAFKALSVPATAVYGSMPLREREQVLKEFKEGRVKILVSCGVLLEGYDEPSLETVLMCRPTKSRIVYIQAVGRGLRTFPGKEFCTVLDFTDEGHSLNGVMSLQTTIPFECLESEGENEPGELEEKEQRERSISVSMECDRELQLLGNPRLMWTKLEGEYWSLTDDERNEIVMTGDSSGSFTAILYKINGQAEQIVKKPMPLEYCSSLCENFARKHLNLRFAILDSNWVEEPSSEGQRRLLSSNDIDGSALTRKQASLLIRKLMAEANRESREAPATDRQKKLLKELGIDTKDLNKQQARAAISKRIG